MRYIDVMTNLAESPSPLSGEGNRTVAANVRAEIAYAGINQGELAAILGLSEMAMTRRLKDSYNAEFSASEIARMADVFGIEPGELFRVRDRKTPRPGGGAGRRSLYLLDDVVGLGGLEPPTITVKSGHLAPVTSLFGSAA